MSNQKVVYILSNPSMPGLVKIGQTTLANFERTRQEFSSNHEIPTPFILETAGTIKHDISISVVNIFQQVFEKHRINEERDFFKIPPKEARRFLEFFIDNNVPRKKRKKQPSLKIKKDKHVTFDRLEIKEGEKLNFKDDARIVCYVHDKRKVKYNGEVMSFVQATRDAYEKTSKLNKSRSYRSIREWKYKGILLEDMWESKN